MEDFAAADRAPSGQPPVSVHFVNNVLAAAAGYIEDDPDEARDVLALLSQFLSYRLRAAPGAADLPDASVPRAAIQAPLAEALDRRLGQRVGPCRLTLRVRPGRPELDLELGVPGDVPDGTEHVRILLAAPAVDAA